MNAMNNLVFQGDLFFELLDNQRFRTFWDDLHQSCPWATVFQRRDFVLSWYESFPQYTPIIVTDWDGEKMSGLIPLTKKNNLLLAAGLDLAEYQGWLSSMEKSDIFLRKALSSIQETFPKHVLYFKYLTDKVPVGLLTNQPEFKKKTFLRSFVHPLMETNTDVLQAELKKKNKKEKINRLNRLGELKFFEIKEINHFKSFIDEMALQSDFRKGAFYNKTFFHDEPERKTFLLRLLELGLLHVSALTVNGQLIACNAGIVGKDMVHLQGINSHSPFYSKYSPGILHFLFLGIELKKAGFRYFDLTPGGADGYKSMLATETRVAYEMWFTNAGDVLKKSFAENIKNKLKPILNGKALWAVDLSNLNMASMQLKLKLRFLKKRLKSSKSQEKSNFLKGESRFFPIQDLHNISPNDQRTINLNENHIPDLFLFDEKFSLVPRMDFFTDCITRIEYGHDMFTWVDGKKLKAVFWYIPVHAKTEWLAEKDTLRLPTLTCSYSNNMDHNTFRQVLVMLQRLLSNRQSEISQVQVEIGLNQTELV
jgi:CelD/BcsL family acetyltransferase involved in cellulose biosynthesis